MLRWLPENISTYGGKIDHVLALIYYIVGAWFLLVAGILILFVVRYRRRPGRVAAYEPGTSVKALLWIMVPAALILGFDLAIDIVQGPVWNEIKLFLPPPDQTVEIRGRQFIWEFVQPGKDNELGTKDDIPSQNQLTVPVNAKIVFNLTALDVLHSFWVPHLRLKQDAVPGRTIKGWFEATKEGTYPISCAELCGSGHGVMKGELHVLGPAGYKKWLDDQTRQLAEVNNGAQ